MWKPAIPLQHLIIQFAFNYLSTGRLQEAKNKRKFQISGSKSGRGRLQGFKCSDLTLKILVFLKTGRWGEVVATGGLTVFSSNWATRQIIIYNTTP